MKVPLDIVAVGARTPVGLTAETSAATVRANICRIADYPFINQAGELMSVAADARLSHQLEGFERLGPLAQSALLETARKLAGVPRQHAGSTDLWLVLPEPRPGLPDQHLHRITEHLDATCRSSGILLRRDAITHGHAGAAQALEYIAHDVVSGRQALHLVLGVDSYIHPETLTWLETNRLFGPEARSGFHPGEAAGCLALATPELRTALGLPNLALVTGVATAQESRIAGSDTGSFGEAMAQAVLSATKSLRLPDEAIDTVYCDINGERYRSEEWGFVRLRTPSCFRSSHYEAPANCWGDVGAASGALFGILAVCAWTRRRAHGPRALALTGSSSGLRGAFLLQQPD